MSDSEFENQPTTFHVNLAKAGDRESLQWVTRRWTPVMLARARRGLPEDLAEDAVAETWLVVYRRLGDLDERDGRSTPGFVAFLLGVLDRKISESRRRARGGAALEDDDLTVLHGRLEFSLERLIARELRGEVLRAIEGLQGSEIDLLLSYLGGEKVVDLASRMGAKPNTVSKRIQRALGELRERLSDSIFDELV